jgi:hypothetical protein
MVDGSKVGGWLEKGSVCWNGQQGNERYGQEYRGSIFKKRTSIATSPQLGRKKRRNA